MMKYCLLALLVLVIAACGNDVSKKPFQNANNQNNANNQSESNNQVGSNNLNNENNSDPFCGDGILDPGELCDTAIVEGNGACPTSCVAPACSTAVLLDDGCTTQCVIDDVVCADDDGCCPTGCDRNNDNDCDNTCGDNIVEGNETCDGDCPTSCPTNNMCSTYSLIGTPESCSVECELSVIDACIDGDGCCADGCDANTDDDCAAVCENGVVEPGETCDGNCPSCVDNNACTEDIQNGSPNTCNVVCSNTPITSCSSGDGCCPDGCNRSNDSDCPPMCGDGIVDFPNETCDGNCPTSCDDNDACTGDNLVGSAANCTAACEYPPVVACNSNDGCCPMGCTDLTDNDCVMCTPTTCAAENVECGTINDGCGSVLSCGTCPNGTCVLGRCQTAGSTGQSCVVSAQCTADANAYCITSAEGYPGGYCSMQCTFGLCNDFSVCVDQGLGFFGECHARCQSSADCRSGYVCAPFTHPLLGITENACVPL